MEINKSALIKGIAIVAGIAIATIIIINPFDNKETIKNTDYLNSNGPTIVQDPKQIEIIDELPEIEPQIGSVGTTQVISNFSITFNSYEIQEDKLFVNVTIMNGGEGDTHFSPANQMLLTNTFGEIMIPDIDPAFQEGEFDFGISITGDLIYNAKQLGNYKLKAIIPGEDREEDISWVFQVE